MVILDRRVGERIIVGDAVVITVLGTRGPQVRLGVDAPENTAIRWEAPSLFQAERRSPREARQAPRGQLS